MEVDVAARPAARLRWYTARLRAMTPAEIAWRSVSEVRARLPQPPAAAPSWGSGGFADLLDALRASRAHELRDEATLLADGVIEVWGRRVAFAGDWRAHPDGGRWPEDDGWRTWRYDPKAVWELHRHQHVLALAAAGSGTHRRQAADLLDAWRQASPPGLGPGWASPYETAHRLFAWPFVLAHPEGVDESLLDALAASYAAQRAFVERRPSRYSSANNHRLAELVGLLAAALVSRDERRWRELFAELELEAERQTYSDGGSREQASGYFVYVLEILWGAVLLCLGAGRDLGRLRGVVMRMLEWHEVVADERGELPQFGDDAEDRWLRLPYFERRSAAALAHRVERALAGEPTLASAPPRVARESVLLAESGYAVLRAEGVHALFDIGELGYGSLAAHGHADSLSLVVDVDGEPVLFDAGTGSYLASEGRAEYRGTAAHNTVRVEGADQATQLGPHLWGDRYSVDLEQAAVGTSADVVRATHDGYLRELGARHTRTVCFLKPQALVVLDRVVSDRPVCCDLRWHAAPRASLVVDAPAGASESVEETRRSHRYAAHARCECRQWRAVGRDVVFATVLRLGGAGDVRVERDGSGICVRVGDRFVIERWQSAPEVR